MTTVPLATKLSAEQAKAETDKAKVVDTTK